MLRWYELNGSVLFWQLNVIDRCARLIANVPSVRILDGKKVFKQESPDKRTDGCYQTYGQLASSVFALIPDQILHYSIYLKITSPDFLPAFATRVCTRPNYGPQGARPVDASLLIGESFINFIQGGSSQSFWLVVFSKGMKIEWV